MGLTKQSMGSGAVDNSLKVTRLNGTDKIIALAGNPNVGKSTVFNALTGLNQHTGNWPGKTVATAQGTHRFEGVDYILVDLPGSYSLMAHSAEEEIARDFILLGGADATIVVCDATCLERNMNLVLQTMEITPNVVCCINLMDEAQKRGIEPDLKLLKENLGIPVVATSARSGEGLAELMQAVKDITEKKCKTAPKKIRYSTAVEDALAEFSPILEFEADVKINSRWLLLRLLSGEDLPIEGLRKNPAIATQLKKAESVLRRSEITPEVLQDRIAKCTVLAAEEACMGVLPHPCWTCDGSDRKLDKILTSKLTGLPIMLALLCIIFWITITGANYPSQLLSSGLFWIQDRLTNFFTYINAPDWLHGSLVLGVYRTLAWVISVMLPPMGGYKKNHFRNSSITLRNSI